MIAFHLDGEFRMFLASSMLNEIFEGALIEIKADFNSLGRRNTSQALYLKLLTVRAQDFGIAMARDEKGCLLDLSRSYQHHLHLPSTPPVSRSSVQFPLLLHAHLFPDQNWVNSWPARRWNLRWLS